MTPLKDALDVANPAAESAAVQNTTPKAGSSGLRSDAVSLDVPVKVHGSRVTPTAGGVPAGTEPFEEHTATMIVFPQGGVVKMSSTVAPGQMLVLTNLKSGHDAICRVVKVRAYAQGQSYVEVEFTSRQAGYWGVQFASDEPLLARPPAPAPPPVSYVAPSVSVEVKVEKAAQKPAVSAAKPPAAPAEAHGGKPESSFVSIGSQEEVQPAASSTSSRRLDSVVESERFTRPVDAPKKNALINFPSAQTSATEGQPGNAEISFSMAELRGDSHAAPSISFTGSGIPGEAEVEDELPAPSESESSSASASDPVTFGRFAAAASLGSGRSAAREPFGSMLGSGLGSEATEQDAEVPPKSNPHW